MKLKRYDLTHEDCLLDPNKEGFLCRYSDVKKLEARVEELENAIYEALGDIVSGKPRISVLAHALKYNPHYEGDDWWFGEEDEEANDYLKGTDMMFNPWSKEKEEAIKAQQEADK